jgi:serine/threonine-protein phosphatase 2A regulatory subunit A
LPSLETLAKEDETVVREQAAKSLTTICESLSDAEVQNVFAPLVIKLAQHDWFTGRASSCQLFFPCYSRSGPQKEKLRKKFIELCNEDTPMIRRACASRLGQFATKLEKQHVLQEILPIFRQLSQDEQDTIRVMCLESLIPMAKYLTKEENQIHTLGTLLAAGEDKSWKVRLAFAKNFASFANSFGKEITDNNLIQTFSLLLNDNEAEVKHAAIQNISACLVNLSTEKICNLMLPTLANVYVDSTAQFRAGAAQALSDMAHIIGKEPTIQKVLPIQLELLKDDSSEVKLNVVSGLLNIARVVGADLLAANVMSALSGMTKDGQWRVRMAVFELIADLGVFFGQDLFKKYLQATFMGYMSNTAASVRNMGVAKSAILAENFSQEWVLTEYIPMVVEHYKVDKKGYNYRMCCLYSLAAVMPFTPKDAITQHIIPCFLMACKDEIPNVKFCVAKLINQQKAHIDSNVFANQLVNPLKEMSNDPDKDVQYFAQLALQQFTKYE